MSEREFFDIKLTRPVCLENINEDDLRELINALTISPKDRAFGGFVLSSEGVEVKFNFGADGNFQSVTAKINGQNIVLIPGNTSQVLYTFKGPPSTSNPGPGWNLEAELTQSVLDQPANQTQWEVFFASRADVLNNV